MERKVGEIFDTRFGTCQVSKDGDCQLCIFFKDSPRKWDTCKRNAFDRKETGECSRLTRKDKVSIYFNKIS